MTKLAIRRPVLTFVVFAAVIIFGGISLSRLPVDFLPDVTLPTITVITPYIGAPAQDVERNVSEPLEEELSSVPDVKKIRSTSQEGLSAVFVEFEFGKNLDEATNEIRDRMDRVKIGFPEGVEEPVLFKFDASMVPVLGYAITTEDPRIDLEKLTEDKLATQIKRAGGVGNLTVFKGTTEREITVTIDRTRFEQSGLSLDGIAASLAASNVNFPVGDVERGRMNLTLRIPAEFKRIEEIEGIPVGIEGPRVVRLGDIAEVREGFFRNPVRMTAEGKEGVYITIQKRSGANTVQVARNVESEIEKIRQVYPELEIAKFTDTASIITTSINNLLRTILIAFIFVVIISFLLLGNFSAGWMTATTVPVSLIAAFIYYYLSGNSLNIVTLSALAITIGMVVDNGIVVLENIFRQRDRGRELRSAAEFGVSEVGQAVLASTLTTVAIFIPFLLVKGFVGVYFRGMAIAIPVILLASLFTAVTLTPMLASRFLRLGKKETRKGKTPILRWIPNALDALGKWYRGVLDWALSHRWVVVVVAIVLFAGGIGLLMVIPKSFMGETDRNYIEAQMEMPAGTRFEVTDSVVTHIEGEIRRLIPDELDRMMVQVGNWGGGGRALFGGVTTEASAEFNIVLKEDKERPSRKIAQELNDHFADLAGIKKLYFDAPSGGGPSMAQKDFTLEIYGADIPLADSLAKLIADSLEVTPGFIGVSISRESANPELWLEINRERAYTYGLTPAQVGLYLRSAFQGKVATQITSQGDKLDVVLRFAGAGDWRELDIESMKVPTPIGFAVPLSNIARFVPHEGPLSIERKEGERLVRVEADLYGLPLSKATSYVRGALAGIDLPYGIRAEITGQAEEQRESFQSLFFALVVGIVLVFLIMSAQFENFREPFIIMFSVPFAFTGVALAFFISGASFGLMAFVGMVLLVGVVVNNAIVLIDYINLLRRRGQPVREAILDAGERRLRPVLMTTLTTVFGLSPLAFIPTEGSEMWAPLGVAVIGGLLFSTLVTLILVPVIYSAFERGAERRRRGREARPAEKQGGLA